VLRERYVRKTWLRTIAVRSTSGSTDAQALLPATTPFTAAGKHSFSVELRTAGMRSVTVTDAQAG